ncbi:MAG: c-type cytochrome [Burkholderiales bacterium]|nr:c-type cytochrome [Burkholderiales bacterium]
MKTRALVSLGAAGVFAAACATVDDSAAIQALRQRTAPIFGIVSPASEAEVETPQAKLGRALFWDTRLSIDGKTACASCHTREAWSADRRAVSINAKGEPTTLHSQPMFMAQDQMALRWYGDRRDGVHQAERSITGSMGYGNAVAMVESLKRSGYEESFRHAFPTASETLSPSNYAQALATYQRTLRTPAPFDAFLKGDDRALDARQRAGLAKFVDTGCAGCHRGPLLGGDSLKKFGLYKDYWLATGSKKIDTGRFAATKKEEDKYVYRVPMLRNVARTGPYFHDGSVDTLEQAVRVMAEVQLGRTLAPQDVSDIVAFLESLTGGIPSNYSPPASLVATGAAPR